MSAPLDQAVFNPSHLRRLEAEAVKPSRPEPPTRQMGEACPGFDATPDVYFCLVNRSGKVVAAEGRCPNAPEMAFRQADVQASLAGVFDGAAASVVTTVAGDGADMPMQLRIRRMDGPEGPLALVEFGPAPAAPPAFRRDPLTQLADRDAIASYIGDWRRTAGQRPPRFTVLFLDLDGFKQVNDRRGHAVGDAVLRTLATRWLQCVREADLVARYGGDEFVVIVKDAATPEEIEPVIRRLSEAAEQPVDAGDAPVQVSVTIGVATCDSAAATIGDLLSAADRDMYSRRRAARS